jgi:hypothetical protein
MSIYGISAANTKPTTSQQSPQTPFIARVNPTNIGNQAAISGPNQDTFTRKSNLLFGPETSSINQQGSNPFIIMLPSTGKAGGCAGCMPPPDCAEDENGLESSIDEQQLLEAAGGDRQIVETLKKVAQDPEGAKALKTALEKGTTFKRGGLEGDTVGLTEYRSNGPVITLENPSDVDTAAHELAHAAYPDMAHDQVYEFGHRIARNLGEVAHQTPSSY